MPKTIAMAVSREIARCAVSAVDFQRKQTEPVKKQRSRGAGLSVGIYVHMISHIHDENLNCENGFTHCRTTLEEIRCKAMRRKALRERNIMLRGLIPFISLDGQV
jgi:hypothetical protein